MAVSDEKVRVAITMPKYAKDVIKEEAERLNLTMSQYVYLTMMANSFLGDGKTGDLAANQLQAARDVAWGYELTDSQKRAPKLV